MYFVTLNTVSFQLRLMDTVVCLTKISTVLFNVRFQNNKKTVEGKNQEDSVLKQLFITQLTLDRFNPQVIIK